METRTASGTGFGSNSASFFKTRSRSDVSWTGGATFDASLSPSGFAKVSADFFINNCVFKLLPHSNFLHSSGVTYLISVVIFWIIPFAVVKCFSNRSFSYTTVSSYQKHMNCTFSNSLTSPETSSSSMSDFGSLAVDVSAALPTGRV